MQAARLAAHDAPGVEERTGAVPFADLKRTTPVSFEKEILPILRRDCLACHNETKAKASLVLETPATILKGSEDGPVVIAGKGGDSLLLQVTAHAKKPFMPPKNNPVNALPLTPVELGLVKLWIDQGATGVVTSVVGPVRWQPLPSGLNATDAVAITPDGQFGACGRANQIFIYHLPSGQLVARLTDPALLRSGFADKPGVAQRDLVQSLAFGPDGHRLASGGYREVKLWRRQLNTPEFTLAFADLGEARAVASSPDGKWLAIGGADGKIRLCDAVKGRVGKLLSGHTGAVNALKFSPGGATLCSGSTDKTIRIWSVADGAPMGKIETPSAVNAVAWLARGTQVASAGDDPPIRIWRAPAGTDHPTNAAPTGPGPVKELNGHAQPVTCLEAVPPDGRQLLSGGRGGTVRLWNVDTAKSVRQLEQGGPVTAVAVRRDGRRWASAGVNKVVKLWNAERGELVAELKGERHAHERVKDAERDVAFARNQLAYQQGVLAAAQKQEAPDTDAVKRAAAAQEAAAGALAEKRTAAEQARAVKAQVDKELGTDAAAVKVAAGLKDIAAQIATLAAPGTQAARDKAAGAKTALNQAVESRAAADKVLLELTQQARAADTTALQAKAAAAKEPNNRSLAEARAAAEKIAAEKDAAAAAALQKAAAARIVLDRATAENAVADQATENAVAQAKAVNEVKAAAAKVFADADRQQRELEARRKAAEKAVAEAEQALKKAQEAQTRADQALQDAQAALKRTAETIRSARTAIGIAEADQIREKLAFETAKKAATETERPVRAVAFSPDNLTVATAGDDALVHTWSAEDGRGFETFRGQTGAILGLAFVADGAVVATGSGTNVVAWATQPAWTLERTLGTGDASSPLVDRVLALAFSPDGQWLTTGGGVPSRSGELKMWRVADGALARDFQDAHSDTVFGVSFSADQKYLASGGADKFAKVFDTTSGKLVKTFEGHTGHVLGVSWKRDGRTLASCGADKVIKIWDFGTGEKKKTIEGFNKEVTSVHFLGGGNELLVSSGDPRVRLIREDGSVVRDFGGGTDFLESAAATPDGLTVIAGGQDSILRVWNGANGRLTQELGPPKSADLARLTQPVRLQ